MNLAEMERRGTLLRPVDGLDDALELAQIEQADWKPRLARMMASREPLAMDTPFYHDTLEPHHAADETAVTLATTAKTLAPANVWGNPAPIFHRIGKKYRISAFGKITTAATPGNLVIDVYFGTGADANGVILASSAAQTLIAAQTNLSWALILDIHCRSTGPTGTLFCRGSAAFNTAVIAVGSFLIPASAAVVSGAVDLTSALLANVQFRRSGSTVETATLQDLSIESLN